MQFTVKDGKVPSMKIVDLLASLKDGDYEIKKIKKDRTTQQNRYLWGGVYTSIAEHTGYTTEELHEFCRAKYLMVDTQNGKRKYPKSTAKLNTAEFTEYVEKIKDFVAPFGIIIPSAEEYNLYLNNN